MNAPRLFREHLPYTTKMLYGTITEAGKSKNEVTNNALMDAFCTNARALLEFFEKEHKRSFDKIMLYRSTGRQKNSQKG